MLLFEDNAFLLEKGEPIEALKRLLNCQDRLGIFLAECEKREIRFADKWII